jgi:hypothetical protein
MEQWTIQLRGGLRVLGPSGDEVQFATRKAGAVVATLALKEGHAVSRSELSQALWPEARASAQLGSLRQALRLINIACGGQAPLITNRDSCRLNAQQAKVVREGEGLLVPEMTEPWFDDVRRKDGTVEPFHFGNDVELSRAYDRESTAAAGLLDALDWASINRPNECLRMACCAPELVESAFPNRLIPILDRALAGTSPDDRLYGWGIVMRGFSQILAGRFELAMPQLESARELALVQKNRWLYTMSSFYIAAQQILEGRTKDAVRTITEAKRLRLTAKDFNVAVRLRHGMGLALIHDGQVRAGLRELWTAREESSEHAAPYEHAYVTANLAWFEATVGTKAKAINLLEEVKTLPAASSWRLELTVLVARAAVALQEGHHAEATSCCRRVIDFCRGWKVHGCDIYAYEMLAKQALLQGKRELAQEFLDDSMQLRLITGYRFTMWDRARLEPFKAHLDEDFRRMAKR